MEQSLQQLTCMFTCARLVTGHLHSCVSVASLVVPFPQKRVTSIQAAAVCSPASHLHDPEWRLCLHLDEVVVVGAAVTGAGHGRPEVGHTKVVRPLQKPTRAADTHKTEHL